MGIYFLNGMRQLCKYLYIEMTKTGELSKLCIFSITSTKTKNRSASFPLRQTTETQQNSYKHLEILFIEDSSKTNVFPIAEEELMLFGNYIF